MRARLSIIIIIITIKIFNHTFTSINMLILARLYNGLWWAENAKNNLAKNKHIILVKV